MTRTPSPFDTKSASVTGLALVLRTADLAAIETELASRVRDAGGLFTNAPVLIDVSALAADESTGDPHEGRRRRRGLQRRDRALPGRKHSDALHASS